MKSKVLSFLLAIGIYSVAGLWSYEPEPHSFITIRHDEPLSDPSDRTKEEKDEGKGKWTEEELEVSKKSIQDFYKAHEEEQKAWEELKRRKEDGK